MKKLVLVLVLCGASSCFKTPTYMDGQLRCSTDPKNRCPGSGVCVDGTCFHATDQAVFEETDGAVGAD